jgi:hypothetical protein
MLQLTTQNQYQYALWYCIRTCSLNLPPQRHPLVPRDMSVFAAFAPGTFFHLSPAHPRLWSCVPCPKAAAKVKTGQYLGLRNLLVALFGSLKDKARLTGLRCSLGWCFGIKSECTLTELRLSHLHKLFKYLLTFRFILLHLVADGASNAELSLAVRGKHRQRLQCIIKHYASTCATA